MVFQHCPVEKNLMLYVQVSASKICAQTVEYDVTRIDIRIRHVRVQKYAREQRASRAPCARVETYQEQGMPDYSKHNHQHQYPAPTPYCQSAHSLLTATAPVPAPMHRHPAFQACSQLTAPDSTGTHRRRLESAQYINE